VLFMKPVSLDQPVAFEEGESTYDELVAEPDREPVHNERDVELMLEALQWLPPRHRQILELRFGIGTNVLTLNEVGVELQISRERARQIEREALLMLRKELSAHEILGNQVRERIRQVVEHLPKTGGSASMIAQHAGTSFFLAKDVLEAMEEEGSVRKVRTIYYRVDPAKAAPVQKKARRVHTLVSAGRSRQVAR
jgi:hypothetical protein